MKLSKALIFVTATRGQTEYPMVSDQYPQVSNQTEQVSNQGPQESIQYAQASDQYPQVSNQTAQVSNQVPQESNQIAQVSNQAPQVSNQVPQVSNQVPQVSDQTPQVSNQVPQVSNQAPQVSNQAPQVSNQKPQVSNQKPQVPNQGDDWYNPSNWQSCPQVCDFEEIINLSRQRMMWQIRDLTNEMIGEVGPLREQAINDFERFVNNWRMYRQECPSRPTANNCQSICQYDRNEGYDAGYMYATSGDMTIVGGDNWEECSKWRGLTLSQLSSISEKSVFAEPIIVEPSPSPKDDHHPTTWSECPAVCDVKQILDLQKERLLWKIHSLPRMPYLDAIGDFLDFERTWMDYRENCNKEGTMLDTVNNCASICQYDRNEGYTQGYLFATMNDMRGDFSKQCGLLRQKMSQIDGQMRESANWTPEY